MLSSLLLFFNFMLTMLPGWILSEPLSAIAARLRLESEAPHSLSGIHGAYLSLFSIDGACVTCGLIFTPKFLCSFALTRRRCFWRRVIVSTFFVYITCVFLPCWSYWCSTYERCLSYPPSDLTSPHTLSSFTFSIDRSLAGDSLRSSSKKSSRLLSSSPFLIRIWSSKIDRRKLTQALQDLEQQPFLSQIFSSSFARFTHRSPFTISPAAFSCLGSLSLNFQCLHVILVRFTHCSPFTISPSFCNRHVFSSSLVLCLLFPFPGSFSSP